MGRGQHRREADAAAHWMPEAEHWILHWSDLSQAEMLDTARQKARAAHGTIVSYSPKVFIPLTRLCREVCHYCGFAESPRSGRRAYLTPDEIRVIAAAGQGAGCGEALFTLGEAPEQRYRVAREELAAYGHASTNSYCAAMAEMVIREFGLIPHVNAGIMDGSDMAMFRRVSGSQGLMLESVSDRLCARGHAHFGSPGKAPTVRLATIATAGELAVPFTTGILIGIGETRAERVAALLAIRDLHRRYGHIQEVIVQNFLPKAGTKMAGTAAPDFEDLLWTVAAARLLLPDEVTLQVPPNLSFGRFGDLLKAGINDWGGISPVTSDHINPEAPWPALDGLRAETGRHGLDLVARMPLHTRWAADLDRWAAPGLHPLLRRRSDADGRLREDPWSPGQSILPPPAATPAITGVAPPVDRAIAHCVAGHRPASSDIVALLEARGGGMEAVLAAADEARAAQAGDGLTYVVNRNINYTNICSYRCGFCAFAKGKTSEHLRGRPYDLSLDEIDRRVREAWRRGATEVCMQGGIHPRFTGQDYLDILDAAKRAEPAIHVHAFSPLEVHHGAATLGIAESDFLAMLREGGLGSLPGTAAEVLSDRVRRRICPDKLDTAGWLRVIEAAHRAGLRSTATIMFGHVEGSEDVAAHLLAIRDLQATTGGFTEFVPLPFVHTEAPMALRGETRTGPTFREVLLMHAVARLVLGPLIPHIQASWVKLGREGMRRMLAAGVDDLGGTLMNESISRAAGADHGQEWAPEDILAFTAEAGRPARQRTTLYGEPDPGQRHRGLDAPPLAPLELTAPRAVKAA